MQKYDLENFEFHINSNVWDSAQDLNAAGSVERLHEVEKHFWTALVENYEVELLLSPKKIKGYTCDCWTDARSTPCMHIAAVAAQVRQYLYKKQENKVILAEERKRIRAESPKRMTVSSMLRDLDADEIRSFVADFARTNRDFSLAFKTRFAGQFESIDNPYRKLLESILPVKGQKEYPLKRTPYLRIRRSLFELRDQTRKAHRIGDYRTTTDLVLPIIEYTGPLAAAGSENQKRELSVFLVELTEMLFVKKNAGISPELQEEIADHLLILLENIALPDKVLVPICKILSHRSGKNEAFAAKIQSLFDAAPSPIAKPIMLLYNAYLMATGLPEAAQRTLEAFQTSPKQIIEYSKLFNEMGYQQASAELLYSFLEKKTFTGWMERKVEDDLLAISHKLPKTAFLPALLVKRFAQSGELRYLKDLKEKSGKRWSSFFKKIQEELIRKDEYEYLVLALAFVGDLKAIESILKVQKDSVLLQKAVPLLADTHPEWLIQTQIILFSEHLDTHFGPPAARHIARVLADLIQQGYLPIAEKIARELLKTHKKRNSLLEELSDIFPRQRRKAVFNSRR